MTQPPPRNIPRSKVHFRRAAARGETLFVRFLVLCSLLLSACASVGNDCAGDSFQLGVRDGRFASDQGERYASICGGSFNAARYREGFAEGFSRRPPPVGD